VVVVVGGNRRSELGPPCWVTLYDDMIAVDSDGVPGLE